MPDKMTPHRKLHSATIEHKHYYTIRDGWIKCGVFIQQTGLFCRKRMSLERAERLINQDNREEGTCHTNNEKVK